MKRRGNRVIVLVLSTLSLYGTACSSGGGKTSPDARHGDGGTDTAEGGTAGAGGNAGAGGEGGAGGAAAQAGAGADAPVDAADAGVDAPADVGPDGGADAAADAAAASPIVVTPPSFSVVAVAETTQCVVLDLGNAEPIHVGELQATLSDVVYELRISAVTGAVQATPAPCTPFGDVMDATVRPLLFAKNRSEDLSFPAGVAYTLAAHQLLRFEIHASNRTAGALGTAVTATFVPTPAATFQHEAGLLLLEAFAVSIPAQATNVVLGPTFFPLSTDLGAASLFRLMGYTHKRGIGITMATATTATDPAPVSIYAPAAWDFASPLVATKTPPVALPSPGGIALTCTWSNANGQSVVMRGASVDDERCAGFISYYPAAAVHTCLHTGTGVGVTVCCPGGIGCQ